MGTMPKFFVAAGIGLLVSLVLGSVPASAHAAMVSTDPGDGERLTTAPAKVTLEFNENIASPAFIVITAPDGTRVRTGSIEAVDKTVTTTVAPVDMKGTYSMSYRVVSTDGHPVEGGTTFVVTTGKVAAPVAAAGRDSFVHRHKGQFLWGGAGATVALAILLLPLRGKHD